MKNENYLLVIYHSNLSFLDCNHKNRDMQEELFKAYLLHLFVYGRKKKLNVII